KHNVAVFSSNYTLYGDMSDRVMQTLSGFCPRMETYSIDEAFLDFQDMAYSDLLQLGLTIRKTVKQHTGIPTTVGIAATKTLAKMANRFAKKKRPDTGVFWAANKQLVEEMLANTIIRDIWGIGAQHARFLQKKGFHTAMELSQAPDDWVRKELSVVGLRLVHELRGIPCIADEFELPAKKNICTSRSFGNLLTCKSDIREALCNYAATCALKLRKQNSCCKTLEIFVQTNPHKIEHRQYVRSIRVQLERPTNNTSEIIKYAVKGFDIIFKEGYLYKKTGIIAMDITPDTHIQTGLFDSANQEKDKVVMTVMDTINRSLGKDLVRMAVQGFDKKFRVRAEHLSPRYTTDINNLLKIRN
ncbi:MAG TPA: Y-family DNA polymerase, partial [Chryseolinea sp.]|nr:Y-family DNA polymerase [Chryseolinea sp.]